MSLGRHFIHLKKSITPFVSQSKWSQAIKVNSMHNIRNLCVCVSRLISNQGKLSSLNIVLNSNHAVRKPDCNSFSSFSTFGDESGRAIKNKKKMGALKTNAKRADWIQAEELIAAVISERGGDKWVNEDWISLSKKLTELVSGSWELMCMILFFNTSNLGLASSLMDHVQSQSEEPSRLFMTYYIGVLGVTSDGDTVQEDKMKKYYDELISESEILDSFTMEVLAKGLSRTRYYRECLKLMSRAKETNMLSTMILISTLVGALRNNDSQLCTYVLEHFDDPRSSGLFLQQLHMIVNEALRVGNIEGLRIFFSFIEQQSLTPKKNELQAVMESFDRNEPGKWEGRFGHVHHIRGRCSVCRQSMKEIIISDEEFKAIQSAFLDQVIVSDNIFYKSSPNEVQSFISFVAENGPFDVVIDGLNVLFVDSNNRRLRSPDPYMLSMIESNFTEQGLNVLILGSNFLRKALRGITCESAVYTTATTEADDAFFLYAALHSGKNTLIVSADKLRDHKFRLEPKLRPIFHRWLKSAQVFDFYLNRRTNSTILKRRNFNLGPVEDSAGWHLPFDDVTEYVPFGRNGVLCLRHRAKNIPISSKYQNKGRQRGVTSKSEYDNDIPWYKQ